LEEYIESLNEHGVCQECRGSIYAVQSRVVDSAGKASGGFHLQLITWGTLGRAFYMALELDKDKKNEQLQTSKHRGLDQVSVLSWQTPPDVYRWLIWYHNQFHDGQGDSFLSKLTAIPDVEAGYTAWLLLKHPGPRNGKSESSLVNAFLDERCKGKFVSGNEYEITKVVHHKLVHFGILEKFSALCQSAVSFRSKSCVTHDTLVNLHAILVVLEKYENDASIEVDTIKIIFFEAFRFMVPISATKKNLFDDSRVVAQIFDRS
jgi:hypothetical protein